MRRRAAVSAVAAAGRVRAVLVPRSGVRGAGAFRNDADAVLRAVLLREVYGEG